MNRILACCVFCILPLVARAENWPQWRGPDNNGISKEKGIPTTWDEKTNIAWKLPLPGIAGSTPAVWGDKILLTSAEGKDLVVMCVKTNGTVLWKNKVATANRVAIRNDEGNEAGASPSTDGKHVYVFFGTGDLACFDLDGNEVWKKNVQKDYGKFSIQHGMHISPLLHEDRLYVVYLTNGGHWVAALDKTNGKEIWRHERQSDAKGESREAYSSPILWTTGKEPCLVVLGCDYATAHRLTDGGEIWRLHGINFKTYRADHRIIATPVANGEALIVPTARSLHVMALKPGAKGDINPGSPFELWRNAKGAPDVSSPLLYDGIVYLVDTDIRMLRCWDAATGKTHYEERWHNDRYRSSPIAVDGKIIANSRDGTFYVVKPGPKYELLAENKLQDIFTASPVVSGGRLYLRGFSSLYAIEEKGK